MNTPTHTWLIALMPTRVARLSPCASGLPPPHGSFSSRFRAIEIELGIAGDIPDWLFPAEVAP